VPLTVVPIMTVVMTVVVSVTPVLHPMLMHMRCNTTAVGGFRSMRPNFRSRAVSSARKRYSATIGRQ
jgi:hypothetical protein